jgi:hypothetical protein
MTAVLHAYGIPNGNQANVMNISSLLFNLKMKSATEQMKINDFKRKQYRLYLTFFLNPILFAICIYTFSKLVWGLGAMAY